MNVRGEMNGGGRGGKRNGILTTKGTKEHQGYSRETSGVYNEVECHGGCSKTPEVWRRRATTRVALWIHHR
jgi:hypothetical protein